MTYFILVKKKKRPTEWKTVGDCMATGRDDINIKCGPGKVRQTSNCIDGTIDKCTEDEKVRNVSCLEGGKPLAPCPSE